MRKRKTHAGPVHHELIFFSLCGWWYPTPAAKRPTCLNCKRALAARKGK